ncbi:uncharacterized protein METZ01_LOCUS482350, partial [marine metagenome]
RDIYGATCGGSVGGGSSGRCHRRGGSNAPHPASQLRAYGCRRGPARRRRRGESYRRARSHGPSGGGAGGARQCGGPDAGNGSPSRLRRRRRADGPGPRARQGIREHRRCSGRGLSSV